MTSFRQKRFKRSALITSLPLTLTFLSQSACHRLAKENISNVRSNANIAHENIQRASSDATKSTTPDPLGDNLIIVIKDWSGLEVAGLDRRSPLINIWTLNHAPSAPYDPQGIESLIGKIRSNAYFKTTPRLRNRVQKLKRSLFAANGRIQNRGQLYDFLAS